MPKRQKFAKSAKITKTSVAKNAAAMNVEERNLLKHNCSARNANIQPICIVLIHLWKLSLMTIGIVHIAEMIPAKLLEKAKWSHTGKLLAVP